MTPAERVAMAIDMITVTDDLIRAGLRLRYPQASGDEFDYQVLRAKYGPELAQRVYPHSTRNVSIGSTPAARRAGQ